MLFQLFYCFQLVLLCIPKHLSLPLHLISIRIDTPSNPLKCTTHILIRTALLYGLYYLLNADFFLVVITTVVVMVVVAGVQGIVGNGVVVLVLGC